MKPSQNHLPEQIRSSLKKILAQSDGGKDYSLLPLKGGANNRVFRVDLNGRTYVAKRYFQHTMDRQQRLNAEFSFCGFAWKNGVRTLPQPLACDLKNNVGLYEFIDGIPIAPGKISQNDVDQVLDFFFEINAHKNQKSAQALPCEREAAFTISQHLICVEKRLRQLQKIQGNSELNRQAAQLVNVKMVPLWEKINQKIVKGCSKFHMWIDSPIHPQNRSLSHSDIGFHNALRTKTGRLRFIDFEYAGWGDPVKMVCDFFTAPKVPVPMKYFNGFIKAIAWHLKEPEKFFRRVELLLPLYRLKWCCILMNDFQPMDLRRRQFALGIPNRNDQQKKQLQKVDYAIKNLSDELKNEVIYS